MAKHANSIEDIVNFALEGADTKALGGTDISKVEALAKDMANSLEQGIIDSTFVAKPNPEIRIDATTPTLIGYDNKSKKALYEFSLQTNDNLFRPSLANDDESGGQYGVDNIVALLNNGYTITHIENARKIHGMWNGSKYTPRLQRGGARFLEALILKYKQYIDSFEINMDL